MGLEAASSTREPAYRLGLIYSQLHDCRWERGETKKTGSDLKFCEDPRPASVDPNTRAPRVLMRIERR